MTQIEISRKLAQDAGLEPQKADAIVQAIAEFSEGVAPVSHDYLDKRLAELESSMHRWVIGTGVAVVVTIVGTVIGTAIAAVNFLAAHHTP
jgi:hypothetical protein